MENPPKSCAVCGVESAKKCAVCNQVYYCGREHQVEHWRIHKKECGKLKERIDEEDEKPLELECAVCGISESSAHLKLCAACQMVAYCGKEHQLQHWRQSLLDGHASNCSEAQGTREELSDLFSRLAEDPHFKHHLSDTSRFKQLKQDLLDGAKRRWLRHALELIVIVAKANIASGYSELGRFYKLGFGVKENAQKAMKYFHLAADLGDGEAMYNLAFFYFEGAGGVPKDTSLAMKLLRKAADLGHHLSQLRLGECLLHGEVVPKNVKAGLNLIHEAADQGCDKALHWLGVNYQKGEGVHKDPSEAVKWYRKAADLGYDESQINLGILYAVGEGVPKDMSEAIKWWRKAADQGHPKAQHNLGNCYMRGQGVPKDMTEAVKWWRKAAVQGLHIAQSNLMQAYQNGDGVPQDTDEAARWLEIARRNPMSCMHGNEGGQHAPSYTLSK